MSGHVAYREITGLHVLPDAENRRILLSRTIRNRYGCHDSANLGYMKSEAWEKFITNEYLRLRINQADMTLCERFKAEGLVGKEEGDGGYIVSGCD